MDRTSKQRMGYDLVQEQIYYGTFSVQTGIRTMKVDSLRQSCMKPEKPRGDMIHIQNNALGHEKCSVNG